MSMSARRQLPLPFELVEEVEVAKQVPHLAMMLSTAFTHIDDGGGDERWRTDSRSDKRETTSRPQKLAS